MIFPVKFLPLYRFGELHTQLQESRERRPLNREECVPGWVPTASVKALQWAQIVPSLSVPHTILAYENLDKLIFLWNF